MDEFFEEIDWLCSQFFFHKEISGDGRVLQGDRLVLLPRDLLCSPGRIARGGDKHTDTHTDISTTRKNWPKGQFFEKPLNL